MSNDEVGLVLVGLTIFFAILGYLLSNKGLSKVKDAVADVQEAAGEAKVAAANFAQPGPVGRRAGLLVDVDPLARDPDPGERVDLAIEVLLDG